MGLLNRNPKFEQFVKYSVSIRRLMTANTVEVGGAHCGKAKPEQGQGEWGHPCNLQLWPFSRESLMLSVAIHPYKIFNDWHSFWAYIIINRGCIATV